jgi:hypothetical protein
VTLGQEHLASTLVSADVESSRRDWAEAFRRYEAELRDPGQSERLRPQMSLISDELRKRVGSTYTLAELAAEYRRSEVWARNAVSESAPAPGWPRTLSIVEGAAFHVYARGAVDYEP